MKFQFFFLLSVSWIFVAATCDEGCDDNPEGIYEFVLPAVLTPETPTISVGDTLSFVAKIGPELYDRVTNKSYNFASFPHRTSTKIIQIDGEEANFDALANFEVIIAPAYDYELQEEDGSRLLYGFYLTNDGAYELEYQLVANEPGLYLLRQSSSLDFPEAQFPGKCPKASVHGVVRLNDGYDNNVDLLLESPNELYNDVLYQLADTQFDDDGSYVFRVE